MANCISVASSPYYQFSDAKCSSYQFSVVNYPAPIFGRTAKLSVSTNATLVLKSTKERRAEPDKTKDLRLI